MNDDVVIKVEKLSKVYLLRQPGVDENGDAVYEHWALKDISFEIKKGESVGIIGPNGSGKSTLLKILAGVTKPTSGKVEIRGNVASILDIGAGFHPELSGRENVFLNGQIHGFSKKEIESKFDEIVTFSGIEKFIEEPVKNYSNGMYLRLAFSIMAHLDFDVYLFDEVFSVGDAEFQNKSQLKIQALLQSDKTILFASHNISELNNQTLYALLEKGQLKNFSNDVGVLMEYVENNFKKNGSTVFTQNILLTDFSRVQQSAEINILKVEFKQSDNEEFRTDKAFFFSVEFEKQQEDNVWDLVLRIDDLQGNVILSTTPMFSGYSSDQGRGKYVFSCTFPPSIFGFQTYRIGLFFIQNTEQDFIEKPLLTISENRVSSLSATALRLDNLIVFKPQLKFKGLEMNLKDLNLAGGLLPVLDWKCDFSEIFLNLEMLQIVEQYFNSLLLKQTHAHYNNIWAKDPRFPYFNYFGINFNSTEIVSVKFYFHVFRKITDEEASLFLPTTDDFKKYYPFYEESVVQNIEHSGCAFEVKFFPKTNEVIQGFHFRIKPTEDAYKLLRFPRHIPYSLEETHLSPGINYEYHAENPLRKTYYYLNKEKHKQYFSEKFNLPILKSASLIEYSESDNFSKINTWYGNDPVSCSQANILQGEQKRVIEQLCSKYNLSANAFGYYEQSDIKAVYLFRAHSEETESTLSDSPFFTDTIRNLYNGD